MTKKKGKEMTVTEKLGNPLPVRLFEAQRQKLLEYDKRGLKVSEIIRRCVDKALADVVREIQEDLRKLDE